MSSEVYVKRLLLAAGLVLGGLTLGAAYPVSAQNGGAQQEIDSEQIAGALRGPAPAPARKTRGAISPAPEQPPEDPVIKTHLQSWRATRNLRREESETLYEKAREKPQVDLQVFFAYDSADIAQGALSQLNKLGVALLKPELKGAAFMLGGHTDAKGAADYNYELSKRRAEAVQHYLVTTFGLDPNGLVVTGFGFSHLKNTQDPFSGENRRVQIVRLSEAR
jgi:outer membrane protein OmpA-like peptidoglycan-associated protein